MAFPWNGLLPSLLSLIFTAFMINKFFEWIFFSEIRMASAIRFLATRMEKMENSFLSIFFEAASKIAESTESKLFFMMESSDGVRKIGGSHDLRKLYEIGQLSPQNTDVAFEAVETNHDSNQQESSNSFLGLSNENRKRKNYKDELTEAVANRRQKRFRHLPSNYVPVKEEDGDAKDLVDEDALGEDVEREEDILEKLPQEANFAFDAKDVADTTSQWLDASPNYGEDVSVFNPAEG